MCQVKKKGVIGVIRLKRTFANLALGKEGIGTRSTVRLSGWWGDRDLTR